MHVELRGDALCVTPDRSTAEVPVGTFLEQALYLPGKFAAELLATGRVRVGRRQAQADTLVAPGVPVWLAGGILSPTSPSENGTEYGEFVDVLYEDEHLLMINKPSGMLIHSDCGDAPTLDGLVEAYRVGRGEPGIAWHVHRLDRGTSGAVLYAKHVYAARALDGLLRNRQISRTYLAVVAGHPAPPSGTLTGAIGRDRHVSGRYRVSKTGKAAVTHYETVAQATIGARQVTLVRCRLETGRTHQIRVHLSALGCPVIGDRLYGGGEGAGSVRFPDAGYALHATHLSLLHPYQGQEIEAHAPLPALWDGLLESFGEDPLAGHGGGA